MSSRLAEFILSSLRYIDEGIHFLIFLISFSGALRTKFRIPFGYTPPSMHYTILVFSIPLLDGTGLGWGVVYRIMV